MAASLSFIGGKPPPRITYPFYDTAHVQKSNLSQAIAVQRSHER